MKRKLALAGGTGQANNRLGPTVAFLDFWTRLPSERKSRIGGNMCLRLLRFWRRRGRIRAPGWWACAHFGLHRRPKSGNICGKFLFRSQIFEISSKQAVYDDFPIAGREFNRTQAEALAPPLCFWLLPEPQASGRKMRMNQRRFLGLGISILGVLIFSPALVGQDSKESEAAFPVPSDWSYHHLIFSKPATAEQAKRVQQDPRYWQQMARQSPATLREAETDGALVPELHWFKSGIARESKDQ